MEGCELPPSGSRETVLALDTEPPAAVQNGEMVEEYTINNMDALAAATNLVQFALPVNEPATQALVQVVFVISVAEATLNMCSVVHCAIVSMLRRCLDQLFRLLAVFPLPHSRQEPLVLFHPPVMSPC
jgi:hypothetical protein